MNSSSKLATQASMASDSTQQLVEHVLLAIFGNADARQEVATELAATTLELGNSAESLPAELARLVVERCPPDWEKDDIYDAACESAQIWLLARGGGDGSPPIPPPAAGTTGTKRGCGSSSDAAAPDSKKPAADRMATVMQHPWWRQQCVAMQEYVVDGELRGRDRTVQRQFSSDPTVVIELWVKCGRCKAPLMRAERLKGHVVNCHCDEFVARCGEAEVEAAKLALRCASEMLAEVQARTFDAAQAKLDAEQVHALHEQLADLRQRFGVMQADLSQEHSAANYCESTFIGARREIDRLVAQRDARGWRNLCPTAELHQALHEAKAFENPLNRVLDDAHYHALKRVQLGEEGIKKGGQPMQLKDAPTLVALAFAIYNKSTAPLYRLLRQALARWLPGRKKVARQVDQVFVATGCDQLEWGRQAARIFKAVGYLPEEEPFGLAFDAAKLTGRMTWDQKMGRWVGQVDFNSRLGFDSWDDMQTFLKTSVGAGYVLVFLLCPLSPVVPSIYVPVGIIPTDLKYTSADLKGYVAAICRGLVAASFRHVIPTIAADNAGPHSKFFKLRGNVRGTGREPGGSVGQQLLEDGAGEGEEAIFSLGAFREEGTTCETAATTDVTHDAKNASLQPYHLSCFLELGDYPLLAMMFVNVRHAAGLHANVVNNSDPMDPVAAEQRLNVRTRRALALKPECLGLAAYTWAMACGRAAWLDREPSTTPLDRIDWAMNNLVFVRWWLDWIEVTGRSASSFMSMNTHAAHVIKDQMLAMVVLLWGQKFPNKRAPPCATRILATRSTAQQHPAPLRLSHRGPRLLHLSYRRSRLLRLLRRRPWLLCLSPPPLAG